MRCRHCEQGPIPRRPARRPPRLGPGRRPRRRRHDPSRDARRWSTNTSPGTIGTSIRPGRTSLLTPPDERQTPAGAISCRGAPTISRHGAVLFGDDLPERRQHHPYAGLRPSDRARRPARGRPRNASPEQVANAEAYRAEIARTGRFLTFCRGRRDDRLSAARRSRRAGRAQDRRETERGVVIRGKIGMHTSPAFAEDVYVGALSRRRLSTAIARPSSSRSMRPA